MSDELFLGILTKMSYKILWVFFLHFYILYSVSEYQRYFEKITFMIYTSEMSQCAFQKERIWNVGYIIGWGVEIRRISSAGGIYKFWPQQTDMRRLQGKVTLTIMFLLPFDPETSKIFKYTQKTFMTVFNKKLLTFSSIDGPQVWTLIDWLNILWAIPHLSQDFECCIVHRRTLSGTCSAGSRLSAGPWSTDY